MRGCWADHSPPWVGGAASAAPPRSTRPGQAGARSPKPGAGWEPADLRRGGARAGAGAGRELEQRRRWRWVSGGAVEVSELQPPAHPGSGANFPGLGKPGFGVRRGSHYGVGVGVQARSLNWEPTRKLTPTDPHTRAHRPTHLGHRNTRALRKGRAQWATLAVPGTGAHTDPQRTGCSAVAYLTGWEKRAAR